MSVPPFYLYKPDSLDEALRCAVDLDGHFDFMGGGTDLLPGYTQGLNVRRNVISLTGISSLTRLSAFSIGACVTLADLIRHGDRLPPVISQTARSIAGPAIRESATVGGNMLLNGRCRFYNQSELSRCAHGACMKAEGDECLVVSQRETCYAIASGDLAPVFMVLGAHFRIEGPEGERLVSAADFFQPNGMKPTVMGSSDLLTEIVLPEDVNERDAEYVKLRPRSSVDFPEAGVALSIKRTNGKHGNNFTEIKVALGALGPSPLVTTLTRDEIGDDSTEAVANRVWKELAPNVMAVRNSSFRPSHRKAMAKRFLNVLLKKYMES